MSFHVPVTCADLLRQPGQTDARLSGTAGRVPGAAAETSLGHVYPMSECPGASPGSTPSPSLLPECTLAASA